MEPAVLYCFSKQCNIDVWIIYYKGTVVQSSNGEGYKASIDQFTEGIEMGF